MCETAVVMAGRRLLSALVVGTIVAAAAGGCSASDADEDSFDQTAESPSWTNDPEEIVSDSEYLASLPQEARASSGGGDPRPAAYWMLWNTCAPENRSAEAKANGGRAEGWIIVDDVLADPGIQLGDHRLVTCEESVALLDGRTVAGDDTGDPIYLLAAQLLAAELNLSAGAETCPAAEEAAVAAHIVLAAAGFDGVSPSALDQETDGALPRILELLTAYNLGILCH
jgi:hypothetical protein